MVLISEEEVSNSEKVSEFFGFQNGNSAAGCFKRRKVSEFLGFKTQV